MENKSVSIWLFMVNNKEIIEEWFKEMKLFEPTSMMIDRNKKSRKYNEKKFFVELSEKIKEKFFNINYDGENNRISVNKNHENLDAILMTSFIEKKIYKEKKKEINSLVKKLMVKCGIIARIVDSTDSFWQNNTSLRNYETYEKSVKGIPLKKDLNDPDKYEVDIEKMPGYEENINNIWYGAAWKMWFNTPYYQYVPKDTLENYKDCYKNEKLSDECICITLYEDIDDYDNPKNRELQWKFKKAINFDELVRKAKENKIKKPVDPEIAFEYGDYKNGAKRRKITYLNDVMDIAHKSKATQAEIIYYDSNGKFLSQEIKEIEELE